MVICQGVGRGQLAKLGARDQDSSLKYFFKSVCKPDLLPGPKAPDSHSFSGLLGRARGPSTALQLCVPPADLEPIGQEGAGSLPPCLGLVALPLLVLLLNLSQDVSDLALGHLH